MSAQRQMEFVQKSVADLKLTGVIQFVDEKPWCVSPLTVSERIESDGGEETTTLLGWLPLCEFVFKRTKSYTCSFTTSIGTD